MPSASIRSEPRNRPDNYHAFGQEKFSWSFSICLLWSSAECGKLKFGSAGDFAWIRHSSCPRTGCYASGTICIIKICTSTTSVVCERLGVRFGLRVGSVVPLATATIAVPRHRRNGSRRCSACAANGAATLSKRRGHEVFVMSIHLARSGPAEIFCSVVVSLVGWYCLAAVNIVGLSERCRRKSHTRDPAVCQTTANCVMTHYAKHKNAEKLVMCPALRCLAQRCALPQHPILCSTAGSAS